MNKDEKKIGLIVSSLRDARINTYYEEMDMV